MATIDTDQRGEARSPRRDVRAIRLWIELIVLFVGVPVAMATVMPPRLAFSVVFAMTAVAAILLAITPGFRWRSLFEGPIWPHWRATLGFFVVTAIATSAVTLWLAPWRFLGFPLYRTELWLMVITLYPIFSVLPQELIYRPLFFERYGALFPSTVAAIAANALLFGLAHAFFHNWVAVTLTIAGGAAFGYAYAVLRSFGLACLWHALAGQLVFTVGLGVYFYHGAIPS